MAGIYIHIPFCRKACHYCNFHFSTSFQVKEQLINAMIKEIDLQSQYLGDQEISTIYFGGGTPSAIPAEDINLILTSIRKTFVVRPHAEITLETNPDDIRAESLEEWKKTGINRLSIGLQAFQDDLLKAWNRSHSSAQGKNVISLSRKAGFENITADLIYGGEGLTDEDWIENIQFLIDSGIPHISCYALTVETGTALAYQIKTGKAREPDDEQSNRQYAILQSMLIKSGYSHYEVSNFSKPGWESKHNTSYWSGVPYLGIGPSAHSYNKETRQWNIPNNVKYIQSMESGIVPFESETLTESQQYNELVMTGLRTSHGVNADRIEKLGGKYTKYLNERIQAYEVSGSHQLPNVKPFFKNESGNWVLMPAYYFFADGIASDLFYDES